MSKSLIDLAKSTLSEFEKIEVDRNNIVIRGCTFVDFDVEADRADIESMLREFHVALRKENHAVALVLDELLRDYNRAEAAQILASIKTLLKTEIALTQGGTANKRIFISHSSKDKSIVKAFVDQVLQLGVGLRNEDVFCTSIEDMTMKNGEDIRDHIRKNIRTADYSLLFISDNYKSSEICLNEMGAVWATDNEVRYCLLPNTSFESIGWLCSPKKADMITDRTFLDALSEELTSRYSLNKDSLCWSRHREAFVKMCGEFQND
ncbi:MAG: toll/interleukin-1 receptor domain-containing protein [Bacteroidales bacterium]|nr:toll/interleukin-1 receptor domain-containing protein [Bacteroidales bacterium]